MKNLFFLLAIALVGSAVAIVGFGVKPPEFLRGPTEALRNVVSKKTETTGNPASSLESPQAVAAQSPVASVASAPSIKPSSSASPAQATPQAVGEIATESTTVAAAPSATPATLDTDTLSATPKEWPKMVTLKKSVVFPAVLNGKVIGTVKALPGTRAHVMLVRGSQVGVEYQGGGAMVDVAETDLVEQVQAARRSARR